MQIERNVPLQAHNTFGLPARARQCVRVRELTDLHAIWDDAALRQADKWVLGAGSNIVLTQDLEPLVLKMELPGKRLLSQTQDAWLVEAAGGENWHDFVTWCLSQGYAGLENLALIPGTVGAAPVQNIGAYGLELKDRFHSLDAVHLQTGERLTLDAQQCEFAYRDSVFKNRLAGQVFITHVRFALPKTWQPVLSYAELSKAVSSAATAQEIYDTVCTIRRAKLPDPAQLGNAGSFFKNPTISAAQARALRMQEPDLVSYVLPDGRVKLAAGWLIQACGWKGKSLGACGVYEKQALVLVNRGRATGQEVMALAHAIQDSVRQRFGVDLEIEPVVV